MYDLNMYVSNTPLNYNVHKYAMHVLSLSILTLYYIEYILASQIIAHHWKNRPSPAQHAQRKQLVGCPAGSLSEVRSGFRVSKQDWAVAFIKLALMAHAQWMVHSTLHIHIFSICFVEKQLCSPNHSCMTASWFVCSESLRAKTNEHHATFPAF